MLFDIIENLDNAGINELFGGGDSKDIDDTFSRLLIDVNGVLFTGDESVDLRANYLDRTSETIEEILRCESLNYFITSVLPEFSMNWHHIEWGNLAVKYNKLNILAARDHGKCVGPDTPILMFDGSIKLAKNIKKGDKVMGVDSKPRLVKSTHKGRDKMFRIHQTKGMSYDVNSKHTMTLIHRNRPENKREVVDIELKDLQNFSKNWVAERYRGFKVSVDYKKTELPLDPYYLGLWLGDGNSHNTGITTADFEIVDYLEKFAESEDLRLVNNPEGSNKYLYALSRKNGTPLENTLLTKLRSLNVLGNKHIPEQYIVASREDRLQTLAGLIDSDGHLAWGTYAISSIYQNLGLEIKRLADSLGFHTMFHEKTEFSKQLGRDYYTCYVIVGGDISHIPTKIKRKQGKKYGSDKPSNKTDFSDINFNGNITSHSALKIEELGEGDYVGFTVDGDNRFLLADGTVTHNSYYWSHAYVLWQMYKIAVGFKQTTMGRPTQQSTSKRGFLFSFSLTQAIDLLDIVKGTIQDNIVLKDKLYPGEHSGGWAKIDIVCKGGARLTVRGFGSSVRGAHPSWIVVDDPLKDNAIYSSIQRKKNIDYFHSVIMNMIIPGGQVVVVGTPFHSNDLYGDLKTKTGWKVREYPAIFPDGRILWPGRWKFNDLMDKRADQGTMIFSRELLCRPVTNESSIFPMEIINRAFIGMENYSLVRNRESFPVKFNKIVTACDFSISSSVGADYTVIMTAGVEDDGRIWLLNVLRFKGKSFAEQLAHLKSTNSNFRPDIMLMENNVFQQIFVQESERAGLPVRGHTTGTNKFDFKSGVPSLSLLFERGMIKIPRGNQDSIDMADTIALELNSITWTEKGLEGVGEHDDTGMCLWLLSLAAKEMTSGFRVTFL